jgi:hypothetical protein
MFVDFFVHKLGLNFFFWVKSFLLWKVYKILYGIHDPDPDKNRLDPQHCFLQVESGESSAQTENKLSLWRATGTESPPIFRLRLAPPTKKGLLRSVPTCERQV